MMTLAAVDPCAAAEKLSISAASLYGSLPPIRVLLRSAGGLGTLSPIRITLEPRMAPEPVGARALRASAVADGRLPLPESRIGARIGGAERTEAASAACQSPV